MKYTLLVTLALSLGVFARPARRAPFDLSNRLAFNARAKNGDPCQPGVMVCVGDQIASCVNGNLLAQPCAPGTTCTASPGAGAICTFASDSNPTSTDTATTASDTATTTTSDTATTTASDRATTTVSDTATTTACDTSSQPSATGGPPGADPQTSLTLDPAVIAHGFEQDGQGNVAEAGQVPSLVSSNNFINFCLTVKDKPITNGKQIKTGSCNPAPMGVIPSTDNMPSCKFVFPKNNDVIKANQKFTVKMAINNLETGNFVNPNTNYYAAPQHLNAQGQIIGHSHIVIEALSDISQTTPTDPRTFAFFKGVNGKAVNGILTATVDKGLPPGVYRMSSINSAANHQSVLVPIAQRGSTEDVVYFTAKG